MKKAFAALATLAVLVAFAAALPTAASAQTGTDTSACTRLASDGIEGAVDCIMSFFNVAIYLMVSASIVVIVWGAFKMIYSEEGREDAKKTIYYGIIGLFVMISIWGLVNILDNTFKLSGQTQRTPIQFSATK